MMGIFALRQFSMASPRLQMMESFRHISKYQTAERTPVIKKPININVKKERPTISSRDRVFF